MEVSERVDRGSLVWEGLGLGIQRKRNFRVPKRWEREGPGLHASWSQTHPLRTKQTSGNPTPALPMTAVPSNIVPVGAGRGRGRAGKEDTRDQSQKHPRKRRVPWGQKGDSQEGGRDGSKGRDRVQSGRSTEFEEESIRGERLCKLHQSGKALFWKEVIPTLLI